MYVRVDKTISDNERIEGFSYESEDGGIETVLLEAATVNFMYEDGEQILSGIYYEDIPNFIKALEAAYEHKMKEKI